MRRNRWPESVRGSNFHFARPFSAHPAPMRNVDRLKVK